MHAVQLICYFNIMLGVFVMVSSVCSKQVYTMTVVNVGGVL